MSSHIDMEKPDWIRVKVPSVKRFHEVREVVRTSSVRTVCDSSQCPNISECWGHGTATFMLLGQVCTRSCRFCAVGYGDPGGMVDEDEPERVASAAKELGLRHAVITSVTRDDLEDGGAGIFARTAGAIKATSPNTKVELLVPDMKGDEGALRTIALSDADVVGHNLEVVRRLQSSARDVRASYDLSLQVLRTLKRVAPQLLTKTSLMLGLGETREEVLETLSDARMAGVDLVVMGQYLRPKGGGLPVERYVTPEEFDELRLSALDLGFRQVMSGPMVRSSYHAHEMLMIIKEDR